MLSLPKLSILLSLFGLALSAPASSLQAGVGYSVPLSRRRSPPGVQNGNIRLFDSTFPQAELRNLLGKYANAKNFLTGIDLGPDHGTGFMSLLPNADALSENAVSVASLVAAAEAPLFPSILPGTGTIPMKDLVSGSVDCLYYGPLNIGTPAQTLTVDVDTGSADLWVPVDCTSCPNNQLDADRSSTYRDMPDEFSISYGAGNAYGNLASDVVSVGNLSVQGQIFGAVGQISDDICDFSNDGILGLSFSTISTSNQPTFFERLIENGTLAAPLFSVHLARNPASGSEVCLGCFDPTKATGMISWVPVMSKTYWSVSMDAVTVNSTSVITNLVAAIDTGTTLIYLPYDVALSLYKLIPGGEAASQYGSGIFKYQCSAYITISLSMSGQRFPLNLSDFNLGRISSNSTYCIGGILALGEGFPSNMAIIGDEFLKSWYSTYDYSHGARVGFSPSINNAI